MFDSESYAIRNSHKSYISGKTYEDIQSQPSSPHKLTRINDLKNQVENYLDMLESKVTLVKEKALSEFIVAYNGYMRQVKEDLKYLKEKSLEIEKFYKDNKSIQNMEQQLEWFREESVKLYTKIELKNKEIFELKFRLQEVEKENEFLEQQIKELMRKNKKYEVIRHTASVATEQAEQIKEPQQLFCTQPRPKRIMSGQAQPKHIKQLQDIFEKLTNDDQTQIINEIAQYVSFIENTQTKQIHLLRQKMNQAISQSTKAFATRSEYEEFFIDCVEQVRKDIMRRRQNVQLENKLSDFNVFRKEDKLKVLELVLMNDRLLQTLHQKIFPTSQVAQLLEPTTIQTDYQDILQQIDKKRSFSTKDRMIIKKGKLLYK
ncbi:unnamed protein product [Paramecium sonneborni]|uniref:Uncharacterized protein n=1 Tax=Paramecium sonneborni TaxID=65129 RepID=A0A8S1PW34_9CILI|nr:unnamed protein product [Paramecium sonneborni]